MAPLPQPGDQLPVLGHLRAGQDTTGGPAQDLARTHQAVSPASRRIRQKARAKAEVRRKLQAVHRELEAGFASLLPTRWRPAAGLARRGPTTQQACTAGNYRRLAGHAISKLGAVKLKDLALTSQAQGDLAGAAGHLKEGLALAADAGDETSAAYYLEGLAAVARQRDNPQRAVRLLAAARSLLETKGSGWLHASVPRAPHDDAVLEALRARMSEAAFEEARAWGASTGGRRAREYALE